MTKHLLLTAALGLALAGPSFGLAQNAPPSPAPPAQGPPGQPDMRAERQTREAEHLKALRDVLGVRPDQEAAFQAYVSVMRPQRPDAGKMGGGRMGPEPVDMANMTTPERLDLMAKTMQAHQDMERARFDRMATATKAFYADLSPEQKRVMDALPELDRGEDWGRGGPMGHRGPHPHPGGPGPMVEAH